MKTSLLALTILSGSLATVTLNAQPEDRPAPPDPETVVIDLFAYDADENNSLSQEELVTGFAELRKQHRGERGEGRRMGPRGDADGERQGPPPGGRKGKKGKRGGQQNMGARLVEEFDATGDGELNPEELLNAITSMHERRGQGRRGPAVDDSAE